MEPSPAGTALPAKVRDPVVDALRTLAILLMAASHTTRLLPWDERRAWSRFSMLIEPLTASLFLILAGAALAHSWGKARHQRPGDPWVVSPGRRAAWYRKQGLRALGLWVLSGILYCFEQEGFHFPDAVFLSGILATIAYSILGVMLLVSSPRPAWSLALAVAALFAVQLRLDATGARYFLVNAGNSPMLPLSLFACLGALGVQSLEGRTWARWAWLAAAVLALALLLHFHTFTEIFSKPLGRYETTRVLFSGPAEARVEKTIPYYNLRPILVPAIFSLVILLYAALAAVRPLLVRAAAGFSLGRNSLDVYVLHLTLLALLVVVTGARRPLKYSWQGDAVYAAVILACVAWASGKEAWRGRRYANRR